MELLARPTPTRARGIGRGVCQSAEPRPDAEFYTSVSPESLVVVREPYHGLACFNTWRTTDSSLLTVLGARPDRSEHSGKRQD